MHALFALLALSLASADVYRWVDADGQAHYTDRPQRGAERVTIDIGPPANSAAGGNPLSRTQAPEDETPAPVLGYQSLTITSPVQEQVLWNIEGQLDVAAAVQPPLQPGHTLRFYLDGRIAQADPGATRTRFSEVFRGEHSLRVEVTDASGMTLVASPMTRFMVRQTTVANPTPKPLPKPLPKPRP